MGLLVAILAAAVIILALAVVLQAAFLRGGGPTGGQTDGPTGQTATNTLALPTATAAAAGQTATPAPRHTATPRPRPTPTATPRPTPTATPTPGSSGHLSLSQGPCAGGAYQQVLVNNNGTGPLTWSGTTSNSSYRLSPASGSVQEFDLEVVSILGPKPGAGSLTITVTSSGGSSSIAPKTCS